MAVKEEFLNGIHEVFSEFFSEEKILLKMLDEEETETNVYDEPIEGKKYRDPIKLIGKVSLTPSEGEQDVESIQYSATFKIPTKELILKEVPHSPEDFETLLQAVIEYDGVDYEIEKVNPETNINDSYMFYTFHCTKPKVRRVVE